MVRGGSENHLEHIAINQHKFTEKLLHQFTAQYFMVHSATTRKLHVTIEHLGTPSSTLNNYRSLNRPLVQNVPEFNDPLRQLQRLKDGVEVISTYTASEWRMTHVESSETDVHRPLDQTASKSLMEGALQAHAPEFNAQLCSVAPTPP